MSEMKCRECGWQGPSSEVGGTDVREDYGDVYVLVCPSCHRINYDGRDMLVEVEDD